MIFFHLSDEPPSSSSFDHPHHHTDNNNGGKGSGGGGGGESGIPGNNDAPSSSSSLQETTLQKVSTSPHHKPIKLHKSLPQPLNPGANDPHELSRVPFHPPPSSSHHHQTQVIVMGGKSLSLPLSTTATLSHFNSSSSINHHLNFIGLTTTATPTSPSIPLHPQGTSKSSSTLQANNIIKPRRLESLSHGISKNRIQNSISFDDEPLAPESSAYNSIGDSSASSNNNNGQHILILPGRNKNSSSANKNSVNNLLSSTSGIRKSPLQIRRDLSRLVAAVKDGGTGNGIDDDLSLPSSKFGLSFLMSLHQLQ